MSERNLSNQLLAQRISEQLEWLQQQTSPIYRALPVQFLTCNVSEQWVEFSHQTTPLGQNPHGMLHGGVTAWLLDTANGIVCRGFSGFSAAPSLDLHINYLKAIPMDQKLILRTTLKRLGTRIINLYDEIRNPETNTLYVTATANSYLPPNIPLLEQSDFHL